MPWLHLGKIWVYLATNILSEWTAGIEITAHGWVGRTGDITLQDDAIAFLCHLRVRDWHGGDKRLGVGV